MAYILTETDLDALQQAGITGVPAGVEATPEEMRILGVLDPALTDSFAMGDTTGTDVTGMTPDPNYQNGATPTAPLPQQVNSQPAGGFGVLDFQTSPPVDDFSYLEDPYSNLSKTQRRMLAFSAIKDAGMALQGKEGNSYATMMADITARADMARKAKAAQQQQAMMGAIFQGGISNLPPETLIMLAARGLIDPSVVALATAEKERTQQVEADISNKQNTIYLIDALLNDPKLSQILGAQGTVRGVGENLFPGLQEDYVDLKGRVEQLQGGVFLEAFESLKGGGQITELEGAQAQAALARLNTAQGEEAFKQALKEYRFYIEQGLARLRGEDIPKDTLYGQQDQSDPLGIRN